MKHWSNFKTVVLKVNFSPLFFCVRCAANHIMYQGIDLTYLIRANTNEKVTNELKRSISPSVHTTCQTSSYVFIKWSRLMYANVIVDMCASARSRLIDDSGKKRFSLNGLVNWEGSLVKSNQTCTRWRKNHTLRTYKGFHSLYSACIKPL